MNTDDKFLVKKDKCESQNHLIREPRSFKDVNGKGDPFVLHVKKSDLDACKITDPWERRRQGRELMKVMTNLMDMDAEFFEHFGDELGIKRHSQPTRPFLPTTAYDNYSLYDIMAEMETLDPLGYDARGEQVPLKIRYITPQKAKKIKVDECGPGECIDEKEMSHETCVTYLSGIRCFFKYLQEKGILEINPFQHFILLRNNNELTLIEDPKGVLREYFERIETKNFPKIFERTEKHPKYNIPPGGKNSEIKIDKSNEIGRSAEYEEAQVRPRLHGNPKGADDE